MKTNNRANYANDPSGTSKGAMIKCGMEEDGVERLDPEQARRILREEMPKRIERLRQDLRNFYFGERDTPGWRTRQGGPPELFRFDDVPLGGNGQL